MHVNGWKLQKLKETSAIMVILLPKMVCDVENETQKMCFWLFNDLLIIFWCMLHYGFMLYEVSLAKYLSNGPQLSQGLTKMT